MRPSVLVAVAAALAVAEAPTAQPADARPATALDAIENALVPAFAIENEPAEPMGIAERMEELGVPGVSIAFFGDGEVVWARAYGLADVDGERPVTPETRFQAASISKPVAATVALDLVEERRLSLDGDVNDVLASWQVPANEHTAAASVTLRGLLTHTAGLTVHGFPGYVSGAQVPSTVGVLDGKGNTDSVRVHVPPRTTYRYSGGGYTVAQLLVSDVTGRPFAEVAEQRVLGPLGMAHSTFVQPLPAPLHDEAATGYHRDGAPVEGRFATYPEQAAAGLWTTPSDLARWALGVLAVYHGGEHPVLEAETVRAMLTPDPVGGHGLGPGLLGDGAFFGHGGSNQGFRCLLTADRDGGRGVVIMTNSDAGHALAEEVVLTVSQIYGWPGPQPQRKRSVRLVDGVLDAFAGRYRAVERPAWTVAIRPEAAGLAATREWDGVVIRLAPESETAFIDRHDGTEVVFDGPGGGAFTVDGLRFERIEE